ncbi:hypothetical protein CROQUDRAFT_653057 [Cronartium quercuum f. sp. fusiforme G11]|uniref:Uncharacterized protein n=1 Tax=Cronartium quercuum f. sp. fusiforme G11 TaxID=708437 RepID=A0A9P6NPQ8_9BASI|nr:hypothetical protein CROQUDRAFT_653057 [Cronartium quercuum f. sp. fusiforme G11]
MPGNGGSWGIGIDPVTMHQCLSQDRCSPSIHPPIAPRTADPTSSVFVVQIANTPHTALQTRLIQQSICLHSCKVQVGSEVAGSRLRLRE